MFEQKLSKKLKSLNLAESAPVKLKYSSGTQVAHYTGDYIDEALEETNVVRELAYVASYEGLRKYNSVINSMRVDSLLDDYERGSFNFDDYVYDVINQNWQDYIEETLEQWDYKRGKCLLTAEIEVPLNLLLEAESCGLSLNREWAVLVQTDAGLLEVEV